MDRRAIAALICILWLAGCVHLPDTAHTESAAGQTDGAITNATPLAAVIEKEQVHPLDPAAGIPLLDQAMIELAKTDPKNGYRGITYNLTKDNVLDTHWLVQSPNVWNQKSTMVTFVPFECKGKCEADFHLPFCRRNSDCGGSGIVCGRLAAFDASPDLVGKRLCLGRPDAVIDRFYQPIVDAQQAVDITLLQPVPDFRFLAALRNAMTMLARSHRAVTVRVLVGQYPPGGVDAKGFLAELVRDAKTVPGARLTVYAAGMRSCGGDVLCPSLSWNHAKIIAIDGKTAVVGGHNMYSQDYLIDQPIHDISMQLQGSAAIDAHRYADELWQYVCDHDDPISAVSMYAYRSGSAELSSGCLPKIQLPVQPSGAASGVPVLATARLGAGITSDFANQDDLARDLIFGAARDDILVAQQDVAFVMPGEPEPLYPELTLNAWAEFLLSGRGDVYLVLSSDGAEGRSKSAYSNGVTIAAVADKMLQVAQSRSTLPKPTLIDLLCRHFHLAPFRFGPDATWPGNHPIGNHGKFWMVDDRYFYIGSDNLYPVDLQEFGYILDDRVAGAELRRSYWNPLWRWSRAAAISGADAPTCSLRPKATS
jgi:phosphatidylserine/phosphatidylglycerophosphate/cardiolipin synthase-like enzyme